MGFLGGKVITFIEDLQLTININVGNSLFDLFGKKKTVSLEVMRGDIVNQTGFDVVVSPTNEYFRFGVHSVDRYIAEAAGPGYFDEIKKLGSCKPGTAEVTIGYALPYNYVIHVVGRKWTSDQEAVDALKACYICALDKAVQYKVKSIAFPSIGTGKHGFPYAKAAGIAVNTVEEYLSTHEAFFERIAWIVKDEVTFKAYRPLLENVVKK